MPEGKIKILLLVQLPPPVHGVSLMNQLVWEEALQSGGIEKHLLEIDSSRDIRDLRRFNLLKIRRFLAFTRQLNSALERLKPDVVYFSFMPAGWGFWRDLWLARIIRRHDSRLVFHLHNRGIRRQAINPVRRWLYRHVFENAWIIHLSEGLLREEIMPLNLKISRTAVIPNGIPRIRGGQKTSAQSLTPGSRMEKPAAGSPCQQPPARQPDNFPPGLQILFLSNLFPAKGIYELLEICRIFRSEGAEVGCSIAGDFMRKSYERRFRGLLARYALADRIRLTGRLEGQAKWETYRRSDIFVFPSRFRQECQPLVLLEAMQSGLPVVSYAIGAIPELIRHEENGVLVEPGNIRAFASAVMGLLRNDEKRERLGRNARADFLAAYTAEHFVTRFNDLMIREVCGRADPAMQGTTLN